MIDVMRNSTLAAQTITLTDDAFVSKHAPLALRAADIAYPADVGSATRRSGCPEFRPNRLCPNRLFGVERKA